MKTSCQCGNLQIDWDTRHGAFTARRCGCDYCRARDPVYVSDPESTVSLSIRDEQGLQRVRQGHGTAEFLECAQCGLVMAISEIDGDWFCVLNSSILGIPVSDTEDGHRDYGAEDIGQRLQRRKANWCRLAFHSF